MHPQSCELNSLWLVMRGWGEKLVREREEIADGMLTESGILRKRNKEEENLAEQTNYHSTLRQVPTATDIVQG